MYLLDTNVVSELRKIRLGKVDRHLAAWADSVDAAVLHLSVITIQELESAYCWQNAATHRRALSFGHG
jgi:toxin FitB